MLRISTTHVSPTVIPFKASASEAVLSFCISISEVIWLLFSNFECKDNHNYVSNIIMMCYLTIFNSV